MSTYISKYTGQLIDETITNLMRLLNALTDSLDMEVNPYNGELIITWRDDKLVIEEDYENGDINLTTL